MPNPRIELDYDQQNKEYFIVYNIVLRSHIQPLLKQAESLRMPTTYSTIRTLCAQFFESFDFQMEGPLTFDGMSSAEKSPFLQSRFADPKFDKLALNYFSIYGYSGGRSDRYGTNYEQGELEEDIDALFEVDPLEKFRVASDMLAKHEDDDSWNLPGMNRTETIETMRAAFHNPELNTLEVQTMIAEGKPYLSIYRQVEDIGEHAPRGSDLIWQLLNWIDHSYKP